eukprot:263206-Amphidinium_carterae.1
MGHMVHFTTPCKRQSQLIEVREGASSSGVYAFSLRPGCPSFSAYMHPSERDNTLATVLHIACRHDVNHIIAILVKPRLKENIAHCLFNCSLTLNGPTSAQDDEYPGPCRAPPDATVLWLGA